MGRLAVAVLGMAAAASPGCGGGTHLAGDADADADEDALEAEDVVGDDAADAMPDRVEVDDVADETGPDDVGPDDATTDEGDAAPPWCLGEALPCAGSPEPDEVCIPGGTFLMGSPAGFGDSDEWPQHTVWVAAFYIDRYEVTNGRYRDCVADGYCPTPPEDCVAEYRDPARRDYPFYCMQNSSDAASFCAYVGKRLPTEAEWEKAARGTDGRTYPWGEELPTCDRVGAILEGCPGDIGPVGSHPGADSPYGVKDMASGAGEYVLDHYGESSYSLAPPWCNPCVLCGAGECWVGLPDTGSGCLAADTPAGVNRVCKGAPDVWEGTDPTELRAANRGGPRLCGLRCVRPAFGP